MLIEIYVRIRINRLFGIYSIEDKTILNVFIYIYIYAPNIVRWSVISVSFTGMRKNEGRLKSLEIK